MSDEFDLEGWAPAPAKPPEIPRPRPFREDKKAEERRKKCIPAMSRRFECPGCGLPRHVEPSYSGEEWHYHGQCSHCGARWTNAYNLMVRCEDCGKKNPITSRNPDGKCKCGDEVARPF